MEAATVARAPAAAPAAPPAPKKRPRSRPAPGKRTSTRRRAAPGGRRPATARAKAAATAPARKAPARKAPAPRRQAPSLRPAGQLIPIAVGTAARVRHLPDSGLMVRLTQGRAWIAVLGVLLAGIVGLNVFTLSLAAEAGQVDENLVALEKENSMLASRDAQISGAATVRHDAGALGLAMADPDEVTPIQAGPDDAAIAAERLAGASGY